MTIEILQAVRDYIKNLSRQRNIETVGDLLAAVDQDIQEKRQITELLGVKDSPEKGSTPNSLLKTFV